MKNRLGPSETPGGIGEVRYRSGSKPLRGFSAILSDAAAVCCSTLAALPLLSAEANLSLCLWAHHTSRQAQVCLLLDEAQLCEEKLGYTGRLGRCCSTNRL